MLIRKHLRALRGAPEFDEGWYRQRYLDARIIPLPPEINYYFFGRFLARDASAAFDRKGYLASNPDVLTSGMDPLLHYIQYGKREGRVPGDSAILDRIRRLVYNMWGGLSVPAVKELEKILVDEDAVPLGRFYAAHNLMSWYHHALQHEDAMRVAEAISRLGESFSNRREYLLKFGFLLASSGKPSKARSLFEQGLANSSPDRVRQDFQLALAATFDDEGSRLNALNQAFDEAGLTRIRKIDEAAPLALDNITSQTDAAVEGLGLVSVIVPSYNAERTIDAALRSLCEQTYRDLEIIVVDDCSTDGTFERIKEWARSDSRIVPVSQASNGGAYRARNEGLARASGEFITTHDADDWSHSQKIEKQVRFLHEDPCTVGVLAHWLRVNKDITPTTNWRLNDHVVHWSHSSFLFRRSSAEEVGSWDPIRIGADTEFIWRMEARFGRYAVKKLSPALPLALALDEGSSLTRNRSTHVKTMYWGVRQSYRAVARYWHRQLEADVKQAAQYRLIACPKILLNKQSEPERYDCLVMGDCRDPDVMQLMSRAISIKLDRRERVGIFHWPSLRCVNEELSDEYCRIVSLYNVIPVVCGSSIVTKKVEKFNIDEKLDQLDEHPNIQVVGDKEDGE